MVYVLWVRSCIVSERESLSVHFVHHDIADSSCYYAVWLYAAEARVAELPPAVVCKGFIYLCTVVALLHTRCWPKNLKHGLQQYMRAHHCGVSTACCTYTSKYTVQGNLSYIPTAELACHCVYPVTGKRTEKVFSAANTKITVLP